MLTSRHSRLFRPSIKLPSVVAIAVEPRCPRTPTPVHHSSMIRNYFKPVENTSTTSTMPTKRRKVETSEGVNAAAVDAPTSEGENPLARKAVEVADGVKKDVDASLSDEQLQKIEANRQKALKLREASNLLQLERQTMGPDWYQAFLPEMQKPYFQKIKRFLDEEARKGKVVYPAANEIYTFTKCPLNKVKVVIIGQDPYHGPNQAHGLCFSVKKGVTRPPSLQNIFRELESDLGADGFQKPDHGSLEGWCTEGVLLLNATLTVRKKEANSHADIGWQTFTDAIIQQLNKSGDGLVFMLWGAFAQKKGTSIDKKKHLVLMSKHPSPMSANQGGWFGCKHFSKANEWLKERGLTEVNWNHLP